MIFAFAFLLPSLVFAQYTRTDLVSDLGVSGTVADPNLVNGWGLTSLPGSPWWSVTTPLAYPLFTPLAILRKESPLPGRASLLPGSAIWSGYRCRRQAQPAFLHRRPQRLQQRRLWSHHLRPVSRLSKPKRIASVRSSALAIPTLSNLGFRGSVERAVTLG